MLRQFPAECLNEIFEYLEDDKDTLHSCLLVDRLWCKIVVRILWRNVWNFQYSVSYKPCRRHVPLAIIGTLISCLPNESRDLLNKSEIIIPTPTSKPPLFNYASFIKVLSISEFEIMIRHVLHEDSITSLSSSYNRQLIEHEIIKMFMDQVTCLKKLEYYRNNLHFTYFPGARNCLTNLSELCCGSDVDSHFFYQLSQMCHNLQSLCIEFQKSVSSGLVDFISTQNHLKYLSLCSYRGMASLTKLFNEDARTIFFTNLKELSLFRIHFEGLQHIIVPNLQNLKIHLHPKDEILIKFLESSGKNLKELNLNGVDGLLGSSIAKLCPNLQKISSILMDDDRLENLKMIFNNCQYLESIKIWYSDPFSNEKETLDIIAKYSQKHFRELKMYHEISSSLLPEDLESFLTSWKNRIPKNSLTLISVKDDFGNKTLDVNKDIMNVIEKYKKLGIIKKFGTEFHIQ